MTVTAFSGAKTTVLWLQGRSQPTAGTVQRTATALLPPSTPHQDANARAAGNAPPMWDSATGVRSCPDANGGYADG